MERQNMSEKILHFDARVMLGPGDWTREHHPVSADAVIEAMDHFGIHDALVNDAHCEIGDAAYGNLQIIARTKGFPRLHPVWTMLPVHTGELPEPLELVRQMRENAVGAAFLPYGAFGIPLEEWCLGGLFDELERARVPVFVCPTDMREGPRDDRTDWAGVVRICKAWPHLPVIITEERIYKSARALCAAMATCSNLYLDMSAPWLYRFVEFLCKRFGAHRIVRGAQLPYRTPGATLMQLNYSELPPDQLAMIAGGNLKRLVSWNPNVRLVGEAVRFPPPTDELHRMARDIAPLAGEEFYDCHGHIGVATQRHIVKDPAPDLIREMDRMGVRACCLFQWFGHGDMPAANDIVIDAVKKFPGRIVGFTALNPHHGEAEYRAELERGLLNGLRGIKLLDAIRGYPQDGPLVEIACRFANEHKLLILNHYWGPSNLLKRHLEACPDACFITGHSDDSLGELARQYPNLYICSCPFHGWGQTERYVKIYGADKILFGSDILDLSVGWGMGPIFYAQISEAEKRLILGGNLKRLLEKYGRSA